jgi:uncharacterized membrane protein YfcA
MKQVVTNARVADTPAMNTLVAGGLIASLLMVEGAVLSLHGKGSIVIPMAMVLLASAVSSIIGFAFSALCGALLFHVIDSPVYAVQVMIVCWGPLADLCAGFLGGLTGGLAGFPGASVTIWCALKGWDKARQRGVYQPFILAMQPLSLLAIQLMQPSSPTMARLDWQVLTFIPAALAGAWLGLRIFKRLSDRQFELAVNLLLVLSGISLAF